MITEESNSTKLAFGKYGEPPPPPSGGGVHIHTAVSFLTLKYGVLLRH
jgi:hypothetical protein